MHQDMDEGSIRQRKESKNGSTGHNLDERTKDESAAKATVLQKDVSVPVCAREQFTQQVHTATAHHLNFFPPQVSVAGLGTRQYHSDCPLLLTTQ